MTGNIGEELNLASWQSSIESLNLKLSNFEATYII